MGQVYILLASLIAVLLMQGVIFLVKKLRNKPFDWIHAIMVCVFSLALTATVWSADIITGNGFTKHINFEGGHPIPFFEVEINYLTGDIYHFVPTRNVTIRHKAVTATGSHILFFTRSGSGASPDLPLFTSAKTTLNIMYPKSSANNLYTRNVVLNT